MKKPKLKTTSDLDKLIGRGIYLFPYTRKAIIRQITQVPHVNGGDGVSIIVNKLNWVRPVFTNREQLLEHLRNNVCKNALDLYWRILSALNIAVNKKYTGPAITIQVCRGESDDVIATKTFGTGEIEHIRLTYLKLYRLHKARRDEKHRRQHGKARPNATCAAQAQEPDNVNHPSHYAGDISFKKLECIDIAGGLDFCLGNCVKYLWRAGLKGDAQKAIEDIEKSRWYFEETRSRMEKGECICGNRSDAQLHMKFVVSDTIVGSLKIKAIKAALSLDATNFSLYTDGLKREFWYPRSKAQ